MKKGIFEKISRVEGRCDFGILDGAIESRVILRCGLPSRVMKNLRGKYPGESIHSTQQLSVRSSVAHALAASTAIEDFLNVTPPVKAQEIRSILLKLSVLHAHIQHFYWDILPDYLNRAHFKASQNHLVYYYSVSPRDAKEGDLSLKAGQNILKHLRGAMKVCNILQQCMAIIAGKFPVIMNIIPGGVSNFSFQKKQSLSVLRKLEQTKEFVESIWPNDVKAVIGDLPEMTRVVDTFQNLISFGSLYNEGENASTLYSSGVLLDGRLEPMSVKKIKTGTIFSKQTSESQQNETSTDFNDLDYLEENFSNIIRPARYDGEAMMTGPLSRMLITHFGGSNSEISDRIGQMIDDLDLSIDAANSVASRLFAEVFEGRFYLKSAIKSLLNLNDSEILNLKQALDFSAEGIGFGKVEGPSGSILHKISIKNGRIDHYDVTSEKSWNFSPMDIRDRVGIVEKELNIMEKLEKLDALRANRLVHSYYLNGLNEI